jgi:Na+/H+ antiporter NhaD/arsenite permease-like protein
VRFLERSKHSGAFFNDPLTVRRETRGYGSIDANSFFVGWSVLLVDLTEPTMSEHRIESSGAAVVMISPRRFLVGCALAAGALFALGTFSPLPIWVLAAEVFATILGLFLFGSFKYQIHKNALTYGMSFVILATFFRLPDSEWHQEIARAGSWAWARRHLLSFHGLDELVHADTMLFILGLTFFVAVIAQTRLLERITFRLLARYGGSILPTVIAVTAVVAVASGILDGVSMIGLTIRTLVIIMLLAGAPTAAVRYAVMVCTAVTTVCGIWLAYGEPPNLIMKANLDPYLDDAFFLRYCAPIAVASYLVVAWQLKRKIGNGRIYLEAMDIVDANAADVRFLQASRHGEVLTSMELIQRHTLEIGAAADRVVERLRRGESLGIALVHENVPAAIRQKLLGHFVSEELAGALERHYVLDAAGDHRGAVEAARIVDATIANSARRRRQAQKIGALALIPFIALLIAHAINHAVPLFLASFAGFLVAFTGIVTLPKLRALAVREARHEYAEYYFLFPLFLSITLLTKAGFFVALQEIIHEGIAIAGIGHVGFGQFIGCTLLSAILDNNVVADFASRALMGLDISLMHFFAMAQIAGYALGGCWTHIGSAQSVVAFAFIRREVDGHYTPVQWIREITPLILQLLAVITLMIYGENLLRNALG